MAPAFDVEDLTYAGPEDGGHNIYGQNDGHSDRRAGSSRHSSNRSTQRLGQYHIIKTLGEGSFGKVKLAVHQVSGQKVALKIISRRKLANRDMAGRVEREIQYLQLLRHPHIIKLYTVITTQSEIIMVLEYAGGELFDYIVKHGKMAEDRARRFFQQIICAVEYCHRHKIVHRDLKPENLLLDENLNVKIADFGLSNIMTDGNFLKTSCGSPNYAAPEVISGKLYAGPEVDVWSCGVILYVLLVGRLPFDDEYIPSLFKKIAQGNFVIPSYLSQGAVHMIKKMLVVNPVHRIDVQEIRQDPWFNQGLADYLKLPVEDFVDTGVDPNKAINPKTLAPGKPAVVQEQLHAEVVGKLGKTMGYGKDDVQEALGKDEPNAIKDAYLIVRENQIMRTNPSLAKDEVSNPYLATSPPPVHGLSAGFPPIPTKSLAERPRSRPASSSSDKGTKVSAAPEGLVPPPSKIGILPTSIPSVWQQYVAGSTPSTTTSAGDPSLNDSPAVENPGLQSPEQQASTVRAIQGHTRSQINLARAAAAASGGSVAPETLTPLTTANPQKQDSTDPASASAAASDVPVKKTTRSVKWQFGIRSRNTPHEALGCIYRALARLGANWAVSRTYIPTDPYLVQVRWEKSDMLPAGPVSSTHNSAVNLTSSMHHSDSSHQNPSALGQTSATSSQQSSANASLSNSTSSSVVHLPGTPSLTHAPTANSGTSTVPGEPRVPVGCYVYIDIQVYALPSKLYMVDFKLDGYERIEVVDGVKRGVGRRANEEKDCTSPFPFLTMVSDLIAVLAEGE